MVETSAQQLLETLEKTWPAAATYVRSGWVIRQGSGGGKRVSAGTAERPGTVPDIDLAEAEMTGLDQPHLFMVRQGEEALDQALAARGYAVIDPVEILTCPIRVLTETPAPRLSGFAVFPPLAVMKEIWEAGGIGPARLDVMGRAALEKTTILGRKGDHVAAAAYVGLHENVAMIHALEVVERHRRQGIGHNIMKFAAGWAQDRGATQLSAAVTEENRAARALYTNIGMTVAARYHYRIGPSKHLGRD